MSESVLSWAEHNFGTVRLGNKTRTRRLVTIASKLATRPGVSLPQAMPDKKDLKAAYRFFNVPHALHPNLISTHCRHTRELARTLPGHCFFIQDKTELDFTHRQSDGLGPIGNHKGQGIHAQTTLAVRVAPPAPNTVEWKPLELLGLFDQRLWTRPPKRPPTRQGTETWKQRQARSDRESLFWGEAFEQVDGPEPGVDWTFIADREGDLSPILDGSRLGERTGFIVRLYRNRRLEVESESLLLDEALERARVLGELVVDVPRKKGQPARQAKVELRSSTVRLRTPGARPIQVVELRELEAPAGVKEPLHWILATTWPASTLEEACLVVGAYKLRWIVEEYHKAWKSGAGVEKAQLKDELRLEALAAILAVVAVRLLGMKLELGPRGEEEEEKQVEQILEAKVGRPKEGWSEREKLRAIAKLGGFLGRKSDGEPGWQTIWRGAIILLDLLEGFQLAIRMLGTPSCPKDG